MKLEFPMEVQRLKADPRVKADENLVALQYGPLIYNVETADQHSLDLPLSSEPLKPEWRPDLFGGVMVIPGKWQDGTPMVAIPNYTRMNRVDHSAQEIAGDSSINYAPGASNSNANSRTSSQTFQGLATPQTPEVRRARANPKIDSKVWMQHQA